MTEPDGIDMQPEAAKAVMAAIVAAGATLKTDWDASIGQIAGLDGQLGNGPLGRAIAADYNAAVKAIRDGAEQMVERVNKLGATGTSIVQMYTATDQRTGQHFGF